MNGNEGYWNSLWRQYKKNKIGFAALCILLLFFIIGLYAPLFASSKPLLLFWNGSFYSPLFRYLFYTGFYTKPIDLFFNILMFTLPLAIVGTFFLKKGKKAFLCIVALIQIVVFIWTSSGAIKNPANDRLLQQARTKSIESRVNYTEDPLLAPFSTYQLASWDFELKYLSTYTRLTQLLEYKYFLSQHNKLLPYRSLFEEKMDRPMPTVWFVKLRNEEVREDELKQKIDQFEVKYKDALDQLPELMQAYKPYSHSFIMAKYSLDHASTDKEKKEAEKLLDTVTKEAAPYRIALTNARHAIQAYQTALSELHYLLEKRDWLEKESQKIHVIIPSLIRSFHWEEDAGGAQEANQFLPWWELTRINRKDLVASLLFGIRVSIVVGFLAVSLSLLIGIPLGMISGYFAGKIDLVICRFIEMWEAMPTFFMLLLVVAITQSKSIFLIIAVLGFFGWTGFCRFIRSEVLRQRKLPYVHACHSLGYTHRKIMFSHILPNAIPPVLTLLPFSMMAAITSEAGLSFLGLGEEGSTSWGVLMDEGRSVFPAESYLLWPPAILLTLLLISIALVGDALRDAIDPKMR